MFRALGLVWDSLSCQLPVFGTPCTTTNRSKLSVFSWSPYLFISSVESQSVHSHADSALITGCEWQSPFSARQHHPSTGKATSPAPETFPTEHCKPLPHVPKPWGWGNGCEKPGNGEMVWSPAEIILWFYKRLESYSLAKVLMRLWSFSGIPLGFAEAIVLERQLNALLLIRMMAYHHTSRDTSQDQHLACLAYGKGLTGGSESHTNSARPSVPSLAICCPEVHSHLQISLGETTFALLAFLLFFQIFLCLWTSLGRKKNIPV